MENVDIIKQKKINRAVHVYPWYSGFTGDLLFYIAVDTLFLTLAKNFSAAQIVSINSLSQLFCIALQFPILFAIRKIGNTASMRLGAFLLLASSVLITFGKSYYVVLLGRVSHDAAAIFKSASVVALENNLDLIDKQDDFIRFRTSANTVYSIITMLISFVVSYMFNLDHYLPMVGCIASCTIGFVLSLLMKDYSSYNRITLKKTAKEKVKLHYNKLLILTIVVFALFYPIVTNGQAEGKLFLQEEFMLDFDVEATALIIGAVVCVSRIVRVFSNVVFAKLYNKYQGKMGIVLPVLLCSSMGLMLFGSLIPQVIVKIIVMALGYTIILFVRDPFRLYIQDVSFENTPKEQHQTLLTLFEFGVKIATAGMGLGFSAILIGQPMFTVISIMFAVAVVEIILSLKLYKMILAERVKRASNV